MRPTLALAASLLAALLAAPARTAVTGRSDGPADAAAPAPVALQTAQSASGGGAPARVFKDGVLASKEQPAVRLRVDKDFKYVGTQSFVLYDVANAEQHFFVDADKDGRVRRLYWVQFEGYLPTNNHSYNYKGTKTVNVGGLDFISDSQARNIDASAPRPDSDGARARAFLTAKGYRMASGEMLWQRLVHLTDETKRNELMVIYMEDLTPTGLTSADLAPDGKAAARWNDLSQKLLERAVKGLKIERQ